MYSECIKMAMSCDVPSKYLMYLRYLGKVGSVGGGTGMQELPM